MSVSALTWAFAQKVKTPSAKLVLVALADYANEELQVYPSISALEQKTCLDRKAIFRALDALKRKGIIKDSGIRQGRTGRIPVYHLIVPKGESFPNGNSSQNVPEIVPKRERLTELGNITLNRKEPSVVENPPDFIAQLRPLYPGIDIEREVRKMQAWFLTPRGRKRKLTRTFVVNWLNKIDAPIVLPNSHRSCL